MPQNAPPDNRFNSSKAIDVVKKQKNPAGNISLRNRTRGMNRN